MKFYLLLLAFATFSFGCSRTEKPIVNLVPEDALRTVFPVAVDSFTFVSDTTYLGYRTTEADTLALITVARTYQTPSGQLLAINLSSFNDKGEFLKTYGYLARDMRQVDRETYDVVLGRLVIADDFHAAEAKAFDTTAIRIALDLIDLDLLASLTREPIEVDSLFLVRAD